MLFRLLATWVLVIGGFGILFSGQLYGLLLGLIGLVLLAGLIRDFRRGVAAVNAARAALPEEAPAATATD
jgi:hypothetical protein